MPRHGRGWAMGGGRHSENRHSPLRVPLIEPAILFLLMQKPQHGYSILEAQRGLGLETIHPSVVYRTLRELEGLNWIRSEWDTDNTQGPPRRIYSLTDQGRDAFKSWCQELETIQQIISSLLIERIK